jgi:hypothetical protein
MISFRSEAHAEIPLPPEVSFKAAFARLDPLQNSFYILSPDEESYMQCGGGPSACTVEVRLAEAGGRRRSHVVGRKGGSMTPVRISMSQGGPWVGQCEVMTSNDAVQLFACFLAGDALPAELPGEAQAIAEYSFHVYGRSCSFASFGDTIAAPDFEAREQAAP